MRILSVRFANINSLKGDFEIDFTNPELAGRGIFAITGRTGSGKTSILDAITLALFGRTPRLSISAADNELMSRGAGFCQSEVTFEAAVDGRTLRFRSRWEQKRARNKPDGNLQPAHMQLVQEADKRPTDAWESSKLSEVPRKIEEITGLDYERFTRTCLLAQGQFAAFLDAKPAERAQILEQITGTDIYCMLSKAAYERHAGVEKKISEFQSRLDGITLLSDEEFGNLRQTADRLRAAWEACAGRRQTAQGQIAWVRQFQDLLANRNELIARQKAVTEERETHADEFRKLEISRKADPARLPLARRDDILRNRVKRESELNDVVAGLPAARQACDAAQAELDKARAAKAEAQQTVGIEMELIRNVRGLDQAIQSRREALAKSVAQRDTTALKRSEAEDHVRKARETIAAGEAQRKQLEEELARTAIDASLAGDLKALESLSDRHAELTKELAGTETELAGHRNDLELSRLEIERIEQTLAAADGEVGKSTVELRKREEALSMNYPGASITSLQAALKKADARRTDAEELQRLSAERLESAGVEARIARAVERRAAELKEASAVLETLERETAGLEETIEELNEQKVRVKTMASFEEQRHLLEDGKPCPLCGAVEHPFAGGIEGASTLKEIEAQLKKAKAARKKAGEALKTARERQQVLVADQTADERLADDRKKTEATRRNTWDTLAAHLGVSIGPDDEAALAALAEAAVTELKAAEDAFDGYQAATAARDEALKAVTATREKRQELDKDRETAIGTRKQRESLEQKTAQKKQELEARLREADERMRKDILAYGYSEFDERVLPKLRERWEARQETQKQLERTALALNTAHQALAGAISQLESLSQQLLALEDEVKQAEAALEAVCAERRVLYQDRVPDEEERKLQELAARHQAREEEAGKRHQDLRVLLEQRITTEKNLKAGIESLALELAEAQQALDAARAAGGFEDEAALRAALLPGDEATRLEELEKRFLAEAAQILGRLEGINRQIEEREAARPTDLPLAALLELEQAEAAATAQALAAWTAQSNELAVHEKSREQHRDIAAQIQEIRREGERWTKLNALIGSASGEKFQKFAQGLTFSNLVYQANKQLEKLSDRYLLSNEGLELRVIDNYIPGAKATAKNLSGGEKFLASLSLALGLAHMVGRKYRMDTLFIDEGFGALDPETLEVALSVLCALHQQGKLIGVISHVESLHDRLPARIDVTRLGGGHSTLEGPGCTRHTG